MRYDLTLLAGTITLLTACGGGGADGQSNTQHTDYSQLQSTPPSAQALRLASADEVKQHLANGLRLELSAPPIYERIDPAPVSASPEAVVHDGGEDLAADVDVGFSDTNVHVEGVDEADLAKYDGSHWFIANAPDYSATAEGSGFPSIAIVATDPSAPSAEVVAQVQLDDEWGQVGEMYLVRENQTTSHIAHIRNQWGNVMPFLPGAPIELRDTDIVLATSPAVSTFSSLAWEPQNAKVQVQLVDVTTPSAPVDDWQVELDGSLIDSRKVGNTLYLITRFDPWLAELSYEHGDTSVRESNEAVLADAELEQLMPHYYLGDSKTPLADDCYLQEESPEHYGYRHLVNITAVDLTGQRVIGSTCLNSSVEAMSMSQSSLYLTGTVHDRDSGVDHTAVHKFALTAEGAQYRATGSVVGSLGWNTDPAFRMHEAGELLRIVTTEWASGPVHRLTILEDTGSALATVATLPNDAQPAPIGKPGEDIYSVRFQGDNAYIVTFRRTDPLYTIDLSDPHNPHIAGELEIPGFATYMHPLANNHLFTLGYDADDAGVTRGIKAELIRINDGNPEVLNTFIFGDANSYSEALSNLRALSVLNVDEDEVRFAFPVSIYTGNYSWQHSGLQMMQVTGLSAGEAILSDMGTLITDEASPELTYPSSRGTTRGVLHDEAVFFTSNADIWATPWAAPKQAVRAVGR